MHWFLRLLINPLLDALSARVIVEVGADLGRVTVSLLTWAEAHDAVVHAIDPDPALSVDRLLAEHDGRFYFHRARSLDTLEGIAGVDLALIDGDHNWYTVNNELRALEHRALDDGREPPMILVHEIGWPYGRRDSYQNPQAIPTAHRQPHSKRGVVPGQAALGPGLNDHLENAVQEGTAANGVMSAVEDFLAQSERQWRMWSVPGLGGLAILATATTLETRSAFHELLHSIDTPEFLREQCEAIEEARIQSERKRAGTLRRLAETQLKQIMRSPDPVEVVMLKRRVRELTEQVEELSAERAR